MHGLQPTKRICVIGAGASGLAALKVISDTSHFRSGAWSLTAFESRESVGGIWSPAPPATDPPLTPLYDSLTTNLPHPIMAFMSYSFPPSTPLFPPAQVVLDYLKSFAHHFHLLPLIQFNTTVISAKWDNTGWLVTVSTGETLAFDHVIVANGHYRLPRIPNIPGVDHWLRIRRASHSAWYRSPQALGHKVLVVGGGPSGQDIAAEMRSYATVVVHSVSGALVEGDAHFKRVGRALRFYDDGRVLFEGDIVEEEIDYCILATGYKFDFPFFASDVIRTEQVPSHSPLPPDLYNSTHHVFPLAMFIFPLQSHYPASSLAFMGLPFKVVPMPLMEAQACAIVRVISDPSSLNKQREAEKVTARSQLLARWGASTLSEQAKIWLRFQGTEQWDYRDDLFAFAAQSGDCPAVKVRPWEKSMYSVKKVLRDAWRDLESRGEAHKWVEGVGENSVEEWVEMMERLLKHAKEKRKIAVIPEA
ncbi:hypothetical protein F5J12DRAFT_381664 [Pisolithus orientalis]|uniref:uncharacterized protein n=1 Tax=Pisolithus orientalis TaxID=936130 RepID=UPI0022255229|nr:uncharacterized protein F5J12DRAFT_381664 [Pisolithus orientalis]KAI6028473.1 hypothetical protein F5J12DRAFT_381664 [Pisolithus orientalis]